MVRSKYVISLNSENFESVVKDDKTDVFVLFTGSNCRLCEDFWPTFINTAKVLHKTQGLIFATIDMGLNEIDDQTVYYYPTVRFYPADNKIRPWNYD